MGKNKTIYFRNHIYDRLMKVDEPGPLINDLLEAHFNTHPRPTNATTVDTRSRGRVLSMDGGSMTGDMDSVMSDEDASSKAQGGAPSVRAEVAEKITAEQAAPAEKPCCSKAAPCQHWQWDGDKQVWKNSISGRERSND